MRRRLAGPGAGWRFDNVGLRMRGLVMESEVQTGQRLFSDIEAGAGHPSGSPRLSPDGFASVGSFEAERSLVPRSRDPLGVALAELLELRGMLQSELARRAGISQAHVSRLIRGENGASPAAIRRLAQALEVEPAHFLDFRLDAVMRVVEDTPGLLDELFEESLSHAERAAWGSVVRTDESFGTALRSLIGQEGVRIEELAEDAELAPRYVASLVERGAVVRSVELIEAVARALDVPPEHFLEFRTALLRDWLRDDPERLDGLYVRLCGTARATDGRAHAASGANGSIATR